MRRPLHLLTVLALLAGCGQATQRAADGGEADAEQRGSAPGPDAGGTGGQSGEGDAGGLPDVELPGESPCEAAGVPLSISPSEPQLRETEIAQFVLEGGEALDPGCWHWAVSPTRVFLPNPFTGGSYTDVEMDPESGELRYSGLRSGTWLTVRAMSGDDALAQTAVYVFDGRRALNGFWRETAHLACDGTRQEIERYTGIGELWFGNGEVDVTYTPFETYVDYWGSAFPEMDPADDHRGTLSLMVSGGNLIPDNLDLMGSYEFTRTREAGGELLLRDMWLGPMEETACGHYFERPQ